MEELRKDLLITSDKNAKESDNRSIVVNEANYLANLEKLDSIIAETDKLTGFGEEYPLIKDIISELESIFKTAVSYLIKELLTPNMVELALNRFSHIGK